jgi:hypothetical protein
VHEDVFASLVWRDKTVTFLAIEPFDRSSRHMPKPSSAISACVSSLLILGADASLRCKIEPPLFVVFFVPGLGLLEPLGIRVFGFLVKFPFSHPLFSVMPRL